jgi:hypothetical protein
LVLAAVGSTVLKFICAANVGDAVNKVRETSETLANKCFGKTDETLIIHTLLYTKPIAKCYVELQTIRYLEGDARIFVCEY